MILQTNDINRALGAVDFFRSLAWGEGNLGLAAAWAAGQNLKHAKALGEYLQKAGVSASHDDDLRDNAIAYDLAGVIRGNSILDQLPGRVTLPFLSRHIGLSAGARAYWKLPGLAVPASQISFGAPTDLGRKMVAAMVIAFERFLREATPPGRRALAADLISAAVDAHNRALVDPDNAGDDDTPAAITYAGFKTASTGASLAAIDTDLRGLVEALASEDLATARWVLHPRSAAYLATLRDSGGGLAYPSIGVTGGSMLGIPAIVSQSVPVSDDTSSLTSLSLIIGSGIAVADENEIELRYSRNASIEMDTAPTGDAGTPTAASANIVSMFQTGSAALMVTSWINWVARRSTVAATLTDVAY